MKREIYVKVTLDWEIYDEFDNLILLQKSGVLDSLKEGVSVDVFTVVDLDSEFKPVIIN